MKKLSEIAGTALLALVFGGSADAHPFQSDYYPLNIQVFPRAVHTPRAKRFFTPPIVIYQYKPVYFCNPIFDRNLIQEHSDVYGLHPLHPFSRKPTFAPEQKPVPELVPLPPAVEPKIENPALRFPE